METPVRNPYPSDVSDDERAFVAPSPTLPRIDAPQRTSGPREVFDALCGILRPDVRWRMLSTDSPPWVAAYRRTWRGIAAGWFEVMGHAPATSATSGAGAAPCRIGRQEASVPPHSPMYVGPLKSN